MGQNGSVACCCCGSSKRVSEVLNDSLQEKLLDVEETKLTTASGNSPPSTDTLRKCRKGSSTRDAVAVGMMPLGLSMEEEEVLSETASRDRIDEEDDDDDDEREVKQTPQKPPRKGSYRSGSAAWDLNQDSQCGFGIAMSQQEISGSDLSLVGVPVVDESTTRTSRITSSASARSLKDDSYASSHEAVDGADAEEEIEEAEEDEDAAQEAVLRRRTMVRPSSSRVFDEEDNGALRRANSRGLRELFDKHQQSDEFGSFSSDTSSMRSFLARNSDFDASSTTFNESRCAIDDTTATSDAPAEEARESLSSSASSSAAPSSPHEKTKKKGKRSPRAKKR